MRIYQVYQWLSDEGPQVSFYRNKAAANRAAKEHAKCSTSGDVEVYVVDIQPNKDGILKALNSVQARDCISMSEEVATHEAKNHAIEELVTEHFS